MDFDLETMNSVRVGPIGQVFWPDHIVFGHMGAGKKLAKEHRVLHLDEIVIQELTTLLLHDSIKQCYDFHYLGGEQRPS